MSYPGAKAGSGVHQAIINQMPPHGFYLEPFLGSGVVMRKKRPARVNVGCDLDPAPVERAAALAARGEWISGSTTAGSGGPRATGSQFFFHHMDGIDYLRRAFHRPADLAYLDPPFLMSSRRQHRRLYRCEISRAQHVELGEVVLQLRCRVLLSGYRSELYDRMYRSWRRVDYNVPTRGGPAVESLWMNYPAAVELHDYRYLGADFRERERLHRQQRRWHQRLQAMPDRERRAMLAFLTGNNPSAPL